MIELKNKKLTFIDLFAGCGGFSLGLEYAGFFPVFVNELNGDARETYLRNRDSLNPLLRDPAFHSADVKSMCSLPYVRSMERRLKSQFGFGHGELDLLVGGPPCQGFSTIGHRRSYSVEKRFLPSNHLFNDMAFLVRCLQPRIFVFENVRGILRAKWTSGGSSGEIWDDVVKLFQGLGNYQIAYSLVRSGDYGVPQNRPRVLLVGIREDVESPLVNDTDSKDAVKRGFLPQPSGVKPPDLIDLLGDLVDESYRNGGSTPNYPRAATSAIQKSLRYPRTGGKLSPRGAPVTDHDYSKHSKRIINRFTAMIDSGGLIPPELRNKKFSQRVLPRHWDERGPSITVTSLPDDYVHFEQPRILSVREWARLQMFPDWYEFAGKRTTGGAARAGNPRLKLFEREMAKYTQIGNAVPVGLAKAVGEHIAQILLADSEKNGKGDSNKHLHCPTKIAI